RDHATPIGAAPHKSGRHGRKVYVNVSDSWVRKVSLRASRKNDDGLAGLDHGKAFANGRDHGPSRDRKTRRRMVRKMDRRPRPNLMVVGQCRESLVRQFLRI